MLTLIHGRIDWVVSRIEDVCAIVAGCAVVAAMFLVSTDAILRHLFAAPLTFQLHLTEFYLLVMMVLLGISWGYRKGGTIQIKLLLVVLPRRVMEPVIRVGLAVAAVYLLGLAWRGYLVFERAWVEDEVVMGVVNWPVDLSWIWVPLGCGLLAIRLLVDATAPVLRPIGAAHE
ncbi:MAG: TRAP transporter small permease [Azospirillaceae bacterium]